MFPRTSVIVEPGGGMYAAINAALSAAREWDAFTYINDDDLLLSDFDCIRRAIERMGIAKPLIVYAGVRLIDANGRRLGGIPVSPSPALNRALYAQRLEPVYQHGTVTTHAAYHQTGELDTALQFCGDSEFLARACVAGVPFVRATGREVAAFRLRAGQLTKNRESMMAERHQVDEKLGLLRPYPAAALLRARWQFRLANIAIYAERIRRHGFISFDQMLARLG
jgi:hypothetical protein